MTEQWRAVLGWEGWYEVSDLGRCRAIKRPKMGGARHREPYPLVLTPLWYRKGYYKIQLGRCDGTRKRKREFLHRLIYKAFHGEIPADRTVNHIDNDHANNRLDNLELATVVEQHQHARRVGAMRWKTKTGFATPRLTADDAREIRRAYASGGTTYEALAARYGVVKATIGHILNRRSWKYV
jgi:hypothetical protein